MNAWTPALLRLRARMEEWHAAVTGVRCSFNACLLNKYETGAQALGWHADREEIDPAHGAPRPTPIASISLGARRKFGFRAKPGGWLTMEASQYELSLTHGSILIMENVTQLLYQQHKNF